MCKRLAQFDVRLWKTQKNYFPYISVHSFPCSSDRRKACPPAKEAQMKSCSGLGHESMTLTFPQAAPQPFIKVYRPEAMNIDAAL